MRILGLGGYAQSGKDTLAGQLAELGWTQMAFADSLRDSLLALNPIVATRWGPLGSIKRVPYHLSDLVWDIGWDAAKVKVPEVRRLMQRMGTEVGRNIFGPNVWVEALFNKAKALGVESLVISDVRFPNEIAKIRELGASVWVYRPGVGPINSHASDNSLSSADFSFSVNNNGSLEDLSVHARVLHHIVQSVPDE